jgi:hypothetical protein
VLPNRNLILGKQGTYVVLAFRRMTVSWLWGFCVAYLPGFWCDVSMPAQGTELYYYDVELVRGTPEYFESLKKSQAIQDEKDKLLMQVWLFPCLLYICFLVCETNKAHTAVLAFKYQHGLCIDYCLDRQQVRQQEQDIQVLRQQNVMLATKPTHDVDSIKRELAAKGEVCSHAHEKRPHCCA